MKFGVPFRPSLVKTVAQVHEAEVALSAEGSITAASALELAASVLLDGTGYLIADGVGTVPGQVLLDGDSSLTAQANLDLGGAVSLVGEGSISPAGGFDAFGDVLLVGDGFLAADGSYAILGEVSLVGDSSLTPAGSLIIGSNVLLVGESSLSAEAIISIEVGIITLTKAPPYAVVIADLNGNELEEVPFKNLQFTFALNEPGTVSFTVPILHAKSTKDLLDPGKREIRVYRRGVRVWGGYLMFTNPTTSDPNMRVSGEGYLGRLKYRYVDQDLFRVDTDQLDIAWALINFAQTKTNGNLGIVRDSAAASGVLRTRKYHYWERYNIFDELFNFTELNNGFDIEITPDKRWKTYYPRRGQATDVIFEHEKNIGSLDIQYDAADVASEVTALGAGERRRRCIAVASDATVAANFGLLQHVDSYQNIRHYATLTNKAEAELSRRKTLKVIPQLSVHTAEPDFADYGPGDEVRVIADHGYIDINRMFRVTGQVVQIADSGREAQTVYLQETTV